MFSLQVKITYLDGKPVIDGIVRVEVSQRLFNIHTSRRIFRKWFSLENGLIVVALENVSPYAEALTFTVTLFSHFLVSKNVSIKRGGSRTFGNLVKFS